ncbi:LysR substrate-binding domain-containing protein [Chloroflexota bacterium]
MIDLTKLQTFFHVTQSMSFSEAAAHLHLTQPAISHHIKSLEQDLGVELFERSGGGLRLTEAGFLLLPRARKLIHEAIEIQQMMESLENHIVGRLRIACSTTAGKYITSQFAVRFQKHHPDFGVSVLNYTAPHVIQQLLSEEADLGVVSYEVCGEGMDCQAFFNDHIILIVPKNHPWGLLPQITPSELLKTPIIVREPTSGTYRALIVGLGKHSITLDNLDIFMEVGNSEAIVKAVEAGFGVSFVSRLAAEWALEIGSVIEVPVIDFDLRREIFLIRPELQKANRAIDTYWSFVHDPSNADLLSLAEE